MTAKLELELQLELELGPEATTFDLQSRVAVPRPFPASPAGSSQAARTMDVADSEQLAGASDQSPTWRLGRPPVPSPCARSTKPHVGDGPGRRLASSARLCSALLGSATGPGM